MNLTLQQEAEQVKLLASHMGYGELMWVASALWAMMLEEHGTPSDGAFIPTLARWVGDAQYHNDQQYLKDERARFMRAIKAAGVDP